MFPSYEFPSSCQVDENSILFAPPNSPTHPNLVVSVDGHRGLQDDYASSSGPLPMYTLFNRRYPLQRPGTSAPTTILTTPVLATPVPTVPLQNVASLLEGIVQDPPTTNIPTQLQSDDGFLSPPITPSASPVSQFSGSSTPTMVASPEPLEPDEVFVKFQTRQELPTLVVTIREGGRLSWLSLEPDVQDFFRTHDRANSLEVVWNSSEGDKRDEQGYRFLRYLLQFLTVGRGSSSYQPFSVLPPRLARSQASRSHIPEPHGFVNTLKKISISVPSDIYIDIVQEPDGVISSPNLLEATQLEEFVWTGDFSLLARNFRGLPAIQLQNLHILHSLLSIDDALALLDTCPNLVNATLGILEDSSRLQRRNLLKCRELPFTDLPRLEKLHIVSCANLNQFASELQCSGLRCLQLDLFDDALKGIETALASWENYHIETLAVKGRLSDASIGALKATWPCLEVS